MRKVVTLVCAIATLPLTAWAILDADNDGMSDVWELRYGFHVDDNGTLYPDEAPGADPDHDGFTNLQESIAGTDPRNFSSRPILRIAEDRTTNELVLRFNGVAGIRYQLQTSNVAQLGAWPWSNLGPQLLGDDTDIISRTTRPAQTGVTTYFRLMVVASGDSDGDGLSDWEEIQLGTDKTKPDTDGDGISDLDELRNGTDPRDFYNGQTPQLEIISGNQQTAEPDGRFNQLLRVRVRSATAPNQVLANAPVTFAFRAGTGVVVPGSNVRTGPDGIAEVLCETTSGFGTALEVGAVAAPVGAGSVSLSYSLMAPTESLSGALEAWIVSPRRVALAWSGLNVSSCLLEHRSGAAGIWETERPITTTNGEALAIISSISEMASYRLRSLSQAGQIIADALEASVHPLPTGLIAMPMSSCVGQFNSRGQFGYVGLDGVLAQGWDGGQWRTLPGDASAAKTVNAVNEAGDLAGSVLKRAVIWQWNAQARTYAMSMVPGLGNYDESFPERYWHDGSLQGQAILIEHRPIYRTIYHTHGYIWSYATTAWVDQGEFPESATYEDVRAALGFVADRTYTFEPENYLFPFQNIDTGIRFDSLPANAAAIWWSEQRFNYGNPSYYTFDQIRIGVTQNFPEQIQIGTEDVRHISYFLHAPGSQGAIISTQPINEPTSGETTQALNDKGDRVILSGGYQLRIQTADGTIIPLTGLPDSSRVFALSHQRQVGGGAFDANYSYEPFVRFADGENQLLPVPAPYEGTGGAVLVIDRYGYAAGALALGEGGGLLGSQAALWAPDGTYIDISTLLVAADPALWLRRVTSINDSGMILCISGDSETDNPSQKRLLRPVELRDIKGTGDSDDQVIEPMPPVPTPNAGESQTAFWLRRNAYFQRQVSDGSIAYIEPHRGANNSPDMPRLVAKVPGGTPDVNVRWRLEVEYLRGNGYRASYVEEFTRPEDKVLIPSAGQDGTPVFTGQMGANQEWRIFETQDWQNEIQQRGFFGGTGKLYLWRLEEPEPPTQPAITFRIGGKNPDQQLARQFIDQSAGAQFSYAYAIARHETFGRVRVNGQIRFYNQFYTEYRGGPIGDASVDMGWAAWAKGWPLYNLDRGRRNGVRYQNGPGGYGMYQLTWGPKHPNDVQGTGTNAFIPRRMIWNWQDNADGAITELQGKVAAAEALNDGLQTAYPEWPSIPNDGNLSGVEAVVVTLYNGTEGLPLTRRKVNGARRPTCWVEMSRIEGGTTVRFWQFRENSQNYVQHVNTHINNTMP